MVIYLNFYILTRADGFLRYLKISVHPASMYLFVKKLVLLCRVPSHQYRLASHSRFDAKYSYEGLQAAHILLYLHLVKYFYMNVRHTVDERKKIIENVKHQLYINMSFRFIIYSY